MGEVVKFPDRSEREQKGVRTISVSVPLDATLGNTTIIFRDDAEPIVITEAVWVVSQFD